MTALTPTQPPASRTQPPASRRLTEPADGRLVSEPVGVSVPPEELADLHADRLVLTPGYVGPERRRTDAVGRARRAVSHRGVTLRVVEVTVAALVVVVTVAMAGGGRGSGIQPTATTRLHQTGVTLARTGRLPSVSILAPHATSPAAPAHPAVPRAAATPSPSTTPTTTPPSPVASSPVAAPVVATRPAPAPTPTPVPAAVASPTPTQLGAQALALVRYPWQRIPGYSIQFLPIADAPSPGFYGNTTFTWGQAGGTSTLYVYPGETVAELAGITAFEIGHEVDAAAVDPEGGHAQIENILGIHPASWAPNCDCAEQGFLSGWYAAAFSNYWSPGVGNWSTIAPMPTGATLAAVEPWLNPTVP